MRKKKFFIENSIVTIRNKNDDDDDGHGCIENVAQRPDLTISGFA